MNFFIIYLTVINLQTTRKTVIMNFLLVLLFSVCMCCTQCCGTCHNAKRGKIISEGVLNQLAQVDAFLITIASINNTVFWCLYEKPSNDICKFMLHSMGVTCDFTKKCDNGWYRSCYPLLATNIFQMKETNVCQCYIGWGGEFCEIKKCFSGGVLNTTDNNCICSKGFSGLHCTIRDIPKKIPLKHSEIFPEYYHLVKFNNYYLIDLLFAILA